MRLFRIILPLILLTIGIFVPLNYFVGILIFYLIFLFFTDRHVFYRLKSKNILGFIAILVFIYPMFGEQKDLLLPLNIGYDFNYFEMSIRMSIRAILLFGFSNILLLNISTSSLFSKFNFQNSSEAIELAMNKYEVIAQQTIEKFKSINFKNFRFNKSLDYIAFFMADLLTYNFQTNDFINKLQD